MEGAPNTPNKKPSKTLEAVKKAARVLAVGTTLAGVPTDASAMNIDGWRRSTNVEDFRNKKNESAKRDIEYTLTSVPGSAPGGDSAAQEERREPGMFDKDIEDAAKRIKAEIAAEEAAKQAKAEEEFEAYKKTIGETVKKEAEQQPTIIVGRPER